MYDIDQDTQLLLEQVLNIAQTTVDSQYDDAVADELQLILQELAQQFGIVVSEVTGSGQVVPILGSTGPNLTLVPREDPQEDN